MPEIIKYTCGSLRQMAERGIELDLEPGRECLSPSCSGWKGKNLRWEGTGTWAPCGPFEYGVDSESLKAAGDNKLHSTQHLRDVFRICSWRAVWSLLSPGNKVLSDRERPPGM